MHFRIPKLLRENIPRLFRENLFRDRLGQRYIAGIVIFVTTILAYLHHILIEKASAFYEILPTAIFELNRDHWRAVGITFSTSLVFFILTWAAAYMASLGVGMLHEHRQTRIMASLFHDAMEFFYVIPLVLVVSLLQTQMTLAHINQSWGQHWIALVPLFAAIFILSGYQIFYVCYRSITEPDQRTRFLVDALYCPDRFPAQKTFYTLVRRIDFQIHAYSEAIKRAFHLSLVATVIVEMIIPELYGKIFPDFQGDIGLSYGVGGYVTRLQNSARLAEVGGLVWALFLLDTIVQGILRWAIDRRYNRHYRSGQ